MDEMHVAVSPRLLGSGENLFAGLDLPALGYAVTAHTASELATHLTIARVSEG
jgi:dihydrofolate reductase